MLDGARGGGIGGLPTRGRPGADGDQWQRRREIELLVQLPGGSPIKARGRLIPGAAQWARRIDPVRGRVLGRAPRRAGALPPLLGRSATPCPSRPEAVSG